MSIPHVRRGAVVAVVASVVLLAALVSSTPPEPRLGPGLSASRLFDALRELPPQERRAALVRLSPDDRSEVWRIHLRRWMSPRAGLSPSEAAVVREVYNLVVPDLYRRNQRLLAQLAQVCSRSKMVFADRDVRAAALVNFGGLPGEMPVISKSKATLSVLDRLSAAFAPVAIADVFTCNCNYTLGGCKCEKYPGCECFSARCTPPNPTQQCGCATAFDCDGFCGNCGGYNPPK